MTLKKITGKDIKEAVDWLWEHKQDGGCVHQVLGTTDDGTKLCFVVGWSNGADYGGDDKEYGYFDEGYCISAKIGYQHRNNAMQSDYDWDFNMPYDLETGDVWDTSSYVPRDADWEREAADYNKEAQKIWDAYCVPNEDGTAPIDLMESKKKEAKKPTCSMQKKKESLAKKNEDNGKEYITEWQADIIKGLEKVKDKYGLVIEYNGPFSDEWKEYPTYSVSVRKGGKKENIGTVGTDYVHAFVEYINPGMNVSHPHKAKDYSAEEAIQVILNSANMCLGKKGESKKPTCSMSKKKESLAKKNERLFTLYDINGNYPDFGKMSCWRNPQFWKEYEDYYSKAYPTMGIKITMTGDDSVDVTSNGKFIMNYSWKNGRHRATAEDGGGFKHPGFGFRDDLSMIYRGVTGKEMGPYKSVYVDESRKKDESSLDDLRVSDEDVAIVIHDIDRFDDRFDDSMIPGDGEEFTLPEFRQLVGDLAETSNGFATVSRDGANIRVAIEVPQENDEGELTDQYKEELVLSGTARIHDDSLDRVADYLNDYRDHR